MKTYRQLEAECQNLRLEKKSLQDSCKKQLAQNDLWYRLEVGKIEARNKRRPSSVVIEKKSDQYRGLIKSIMGNYSISSHIRDRIRIKFNFINLD